MAEPHRTDAYVAPGFLRNAAVIEDGRDLALRIVTETDPDRVADLIEHAVDSTDRAHAVIFALMLEARGIDPGPGLLASPTSVPAPTDRLWTPEGT